MSFTGKSINTPIPAIPAESPLIPDETKPVIKWAYNGPYAPYYTQAAARSRVPMSLLVSFMVVETGGYYPNTNKMKSLVTGEELSTGLHQIAPGGFYDVLVFELNTNRLNTEEKELIDRFVPSLNIKNVKTLPQKPSSQVLNSLQQAFLIPEFNIGAFAIWLRHLMDANLSPMTGQLRLDKVIHMFNAGPYRQKAKDKYGLDIKKVWDVLSIGELYLKFLPITRAYVQKVLGVNGTLDLIVNKKIV